MALSIIISKNNIKKKKFWKSVLNHSRHVFIFNIIFYNKMSCLLYLLFFILNIETNIV